MHRNLEEKILFKDINIKQVKKIVSKKVLGYLKIELFSANQNPEIFRVLINNSNTKTSFKLLKLRHRTKTNS